MFDLDQTVTICDEGKKKGTKRISMGLDNWLWLSKRYYGRILQYGTVTAITSGRAWYGRYGRSLVVRQWDNVHSNTVQRTQYQGT